MTRAHVAAVGLAGLLLVSCGGAVDDQADPAPRQDATSSAPSTSPAVPDDANAPIGDGALPDLGDRDLDVLDYALDLAYVPASGELVGEAGITFTTLRPVSRIALDVVGLDIGSVTTAEAVELTVTQTPTKLWIDLPGVVSPGDEAEVRITYRGVPTPVPTAALDDVAVGWQSRADHSFVLAEPEGARSWYPVNDHPTDKATYTIAVTAPDDRVALANGALVDTSTPDAGATRWVYRMDAPMAPYLATVVTGPYVEADAIRASGVDQTFWAASAPDAQAALLEQVDVLAFLVDWLGPFPFDTYAGVHLEPDPEVRFFNGVALESQTLSIFGSRMLMTDVVVHEAAHQWFGNSVSPTDWSRDIWWVEGFAHFAEWRYVEATRGADAYRRILAAGRATLAEASRPYPAGDLPLRELFSDWSYVRGALTFAALREELGDADFDTFLRTFVDRYRHGNATTEDLMAVAEEISGKELSGLFEAWLFRPALPRPPR